MKLFKLSLLLLLQMSPIFVHGNGEAVPDYKCEDTKTSIAESVQSASAKLTEGCVFNGGGITFDLDAMYKAAALKIPKPTNVVIDITAAVFTDSYIKLINAHLIPADTQMPLQFTMSKSKMSGSSRMEFGSEGKIFKLPPRSLLHIIDSQLTISSTAEIDPNSHIFKLPSNDMFTFHSLELVTESSIEITKNVITMDCKGCEYMSVFYLPSNTKIKISDKSSFTLRDNKINMTGHGQLNKHKDTYQSVLYGSTGSLTISDNSNYTWKSNTISMVGHTVGRNLIRVYVMKNSS